MFNYSILIIVSFYFIPIFATFSLSSPHLPLLRPPTPFVHVCFMFMRMVLLILMLSQYLSHYLPPPSCCSSDFPSCFEPFFSSLSLMLSCFSSPCAFSVVASPPSPIPVSNSFSSFFFFTRRSPPTFPLYYHLRSPFTSLVHPTLPSPI